MARYLVVDDSPSVRLMLRSALKKVAGEGARVDEAADGDEALRAFQAEAPDVTFLDMMLGTQAKGGAVLEAMLAHQPDARVVIVTGLPPEHEDVVEAVSRGAFGVLHKPVRSDAVRDILDQVREESGSAGRIR